MTTATRATARRWTLALAVGALVASLPAIVSALPVRAAVESPAALLARAVRSSARPYSGLVESRGSLEVPDLPRTGETGRLLGGTSRLRVWWAGSAEWRVDLLATGGETDTYRHDGATVRWDSSRNRVSRSYAAAPRVRVPAPSDLLPPQLAARLLSVATDREVQGQRSRRIAGREAVGLRVVPSDPDTTIGRIDVWVDRSTGLPLDVRVSARGHRSPQVRSQFLDVRIGRPAPAVLAFAAPLGARFSHNRSPDLAATVDALGPAALPDRLAGLGRSRGPAALPGTGAVATYGDGYTLLAVLPLPSWIAARAVATLRTARPLDVAGADAVVVPLGVATCAVMATGDRGYLLAGTVTERLVSRAAADLVAHPLGVAS